MPPKRKRVAETVEDAVAAPNKRVTKASSKASTQKNGAKNNATATNAKAPIPIPIPVKATKPSAPPASAPKMPAPYSDGRMIQTFKEYADDGKDVMSSDGMQRLFEDAGISLEGVIPFLLAFTCQAEEFGALRLEEWKHLMELKVDTPRRLEVAMTTLSQRLYRHHALDAPLVPPPPPPPASKKKNKKKTAEEPPPPPVVQEEDEEDTKPTFKEFYTFCFGLMKKPEARVLEMEMATATWSVVLQPKFPIAKHLLEFIEAHPSYKAVNKDLWTMTLEFCWAVEEKDLMTWNDDESWPSMLDEFVAWEKKRRSVAPVDEDVEMA